MALSTDNTLTQNNTPDPTVAGNNVLSPQLSSAITPAPSIDAKTLGNSLPIITPTVPNNSNDFVQSLATGIPGVASIQELNKAENTAQGTVDQTTNQINDLLTQLGYKQQDTNALQNAQNIPQLSKTLQDLNTQFAQRKGEYDIAQQKIVSQPLETGYMLGQTGILQANRAVELGALSAQIQAAQGNLNTAFNLVDKTISQKYQPVIDRLNALKDFYTINKDRLTIAQQRVATRQAAVVEAQKAEAANQYKIEQDSASALSQAIKMGYIDAATGFQAISDLASGKKTPAQISKDLGISLNAGGTGAGSGAINAARVIGLQATTTPLADVISQYGIDKVVAGIMSNEGGSPAGVKNNPGNIKFAGLPGQIDSGIKASDGGTFASYATPQAGKDAIASIVQNAAQGKSGAYGINPTFEEFMNKYTNTQPTQPRIPGVTGSPTIDATRQGYATVPVPNSGGLTQASIDQKALEIAMGDAKAPSGGSGVTMLQNRAINNRVGELNASGNIATNKAQLKTLTSSLKTQQTYADTLERSLNNAEAGFNQVVSDFRGKGINESIPIINAINNPVKYNLGDTDIAAFKAGLNEVAQEYQQVFSRGGQVTDTVRNKSNEIINGNMSIKQLTAIIQELKTQGEINKQGSQAQIQKIQNQINGIVTGAPGSKPLQTTDSFQSTPSGVKYKIVQ